jgi:hypothetical protein
MRRHDPMRTLCRAALLLAILGLAACSSPTSSSTDYFDITYTYDPSPAIASASSGVQYKVTNADDTISYFDYSFRTSFTVHIAQGAAYAVDITAIDLKVQQATGGIVVNPSGGESVYFKFNSSAVTKHINKDGSADVGFDVWYDLPSKGREALVTVAFSFQYTDSDDNQYSYSKTADVLVAP